MLCLLALLTVSLAKVYILSPDELIQEQAQVRPYGEISSSLANFGNPPYGTSMIGQLYNTYSNETLACGDLDPVNFNNEDGNLPIVLVERGECPFVMKVRHAQDIGARAVLIQDNKDGEDVERIVMVDNGTGGNLSIPSFIIPKSGGELLKKYLEKEDEKHHVMIKLTFELDLKPRISYGIFYSSGDANSRHFLFEWASWGKKFHKVFADFTPGIVTFQDSKAARNHFVEATENCLGGGRYCYTDPDQDGRLTGRDIIMEDLRLMCIFEQTKNEVNFDKWFNYVFYHVELCSIIGAKFTADWAETQMKKVGISVSEVNQCIEDSVEGDDIDVDDNTILREQYTLWKSLGMPLHPLIIINDQTYRGDLEIEEVKLALCAGFEPMSRPSFCQTWIIHPANEDETDDSSSQSDGISNTALIILCVTLVVIVTLVLVVVCWKFWMKKDMDSDMKGQINMAVGQFFELNDGPVAQDRPLVQAMNK